MATTTALAGANDDLARRLGGAWGWILLRGVASIAFGVMLVGAAFRLKQHAGA